MNAPQADSPESLYLIAHKVRGEPAFDIATQIECPCCQPWQDISCNECEDLRYWWIIPTSGHRAYPYNWAYYDFESLLPPDNPMPDGLPDHYTVAAAPHSSRPAFLQSLLAKPRVSIPRRGL